MLSVGIAVAAQQVYMLAVLAVQFRVGSFTGDAAAVSQNVYCTYLLRSPSLVPQRLYLRFVTCHYVYTYICVTRIHTLAHCLCVCSHQTNIHTNTHTVNREIDEKTGFRTKCVLCVPVNDHSGNVLAVVQAVNKQVCVYTATLSLIVETVSCDRCNAPQKAL
jgi:hypothetical protein